METTGPFDLVGLGDRNTKFFHAQASERKRRNTIRRLKDEDGGIVAEKHLKTFIANQYQQIFMSSTGINMDDVHACVQTKVSQSINDNLAVPFTNEEVWRALKDMGDLKAPGSDDMPVIFYKKFWNLVGDKVKEEVIQVLNGADMPAGWNDIVIVLLCRTS